MVVGIALSATFLVSLGAVVQRNHVTVGFVILNWFLIVDALLVTTVGTIIWFFSLRQRNEFQKNWTALPPADRITLQDEVRLLGFDVIRSWKVLKHHTVQLLRLPHRGRRRDWRQLLPEHDFYTRPQHHNSVELLCFAHYGLHGLRP
jgi:hypothetical protein